MKTEAETGVMWPQPRNGRNHRRLEEAEKDSPLETLQGVKPC